MTSGIMTDIFKSMTYTWSWLHNVHSKHAVCTKYIQDQSAPVQVHKYLTNEHKMC